MWRYGAGFGFVKRRFNVKILYEMTFHEDFYGSRSFRGLSQEKSVLQEVVHDDNRKMSILVRIYL